MAAAAVPKTTRRHSGGRPSQAEAQKRDERLVEIAAAMFMERGFDATTVDAVAEAASVGKATVYARYKDKADLFAAVFRQKVDRWLAISAAINAADGPIEAVLLDLARRMIAMALTPETIAINRIISAQALRFPDLAQLVYKEGSQRHVAQLADLLRAFALRGEIISDDPEVEAEMFVSLVAGRLIRLAMFGIEADPEQIDRRLRAAVSLFLDGVRRRRD